MAGIEFKDVARRLSCREFAEAEGLPMKSGRLQCPLHGGHNFNMAFCNDGQRVYCHKCGRSGDVVTLAASVWRLNQRDAAVALNERFKLGLDAASDADLTRINRERNRAMLAKDLERARYYERIARERFDMAVEMGLSDTDDAFKTAETLLNYELENVRACQARFDALEGGVTR